MNLSKKNRIVFFVVLIFIYILFFNIYNVKADALAEISPGYLYYTAWDGYEKQVLSTSSLQTTTFLDYDYYLPSNVSNYDKLMGVFASPTNINNTHGQYFVYLFYSTQYLTNLSPVFLGSNDTYTTDECYLYYPTSSDAEIQLGVYYCSLSSSDNINYYGIKGDYLANGLPVSTMGLSKLYVFSDETAMIEFKDIFKSHFESGENDGTLDQQVTNIYNSLINPYIDDSGWGASISFWNTHNASNSVITNVITLPITLLQALLTNASDTCFSFSLGSLYNKPLSMPCIDLSRYLGNSLITIIDTIFAGFIIYNCGKKFVKIFDDLTNLRDNQINELYGGGK